MITALILTLSGCDVNRRQGLNRAAGEIDASAPEAAAIALREVYRAQVANYDFERLITIWITPDWTHKLGKVFVDAERATLWVQYRLTRHGSGGDPAHLLAIDLRSGKRLRTVRLPGRADLSGSIPYDVGDIAFDFRHQRAYWEQHLGHSSAILALDLQHDKANSVLRDQQRDKDGNLPEHSYHPSLPHAAFVDDDRVLLFRSPFRWSDASPELPHEACHIDRATATLIQKVRLPAISESAFHRLEYIGGVDDLIMVSNREELFVLKTASDPATIVARRPLGEWIDNAWALDAANHRLVVSERKGRGRRVCVYQLPELELAQELPLSVDRFLETPMLVLPGSSTLVALDSSKIRIRVANEIDLVFYDLDTGGELLRRRAGGLPDYSGLWSLVTDPAGRYVGVSAAEWVQVFELLPAIPDRRENQAGPDPGGHTRLGEPQFAPLTARHQRSSWRYIP